MQGDPALGQCSAADIFTFLNETQTWMDATDWVERYSWLGGTVNVAGVNPVSFILRLPTYDVCLHVVIA